MKRTYEVRDRADKRAIREFLKVVSLRLCKRG